ncbi:MAG TPA: hypothetical protein VFG10_02750 [Saprospiraceae bacterium]|nr:hypothetical protein [Saprospiraceae bacterium]
MNDQLTQDKKDQFRNDMANNNFSPQVEILKLVSEGYEVEKAKDLIVAEMKAYKKEVFEKVVKRNNQNEMSKVMLIVILLIAFIGPVASIVSFKWYAIAVLLAGAAGYFGWKDKPAAGVVGAIIMVIAFPFAYNFYFADRESFIRIEIVIPLLIAGAPAVIAYKILASFYSDPDYD